MLVVAMTLRAAALSLRKALHQAALLLPLAMDLGTRGLRHPLSEAKYKW